MFLPSCLPRVLFDLNLEPLGCLFSSIWSILGLTCSLQLPSKRHLDSTWRFKLTSQRRLDSTWRFKLTSKCHLDSIIAALQALSKWLSSATWSPLGPASLPPSLACPLACLALLIELPRLLPVTAKLYFDSTWLCKVVSKRYLESTWLGGLASKLALVSQLNLQSSSV